MKITRNVLNDLLPAYLSGEASEDTRNLIADFSQSDPDFAAALEKQRREVSDQNRLLQGDQLGLTPDHELHTLAQTKAMLERQRWSLGFALMFTAFPCSFVFDNGEVRFLLFRDQPLVAAVCWILALVLWALHFHTRKKVGAKGL